MAAIRNSFLLTDEQRAELADQFNTIDKNGNGFLELSELKSALDLVGFRIPQWQVRQMVDEVDKQRTITDKGKLSFEEFQKMCVDLKAKEFSTTFKSMVSKKDNVETLGGMSYASSEGTTHSVRQEEQIAFADWLNTNLANDPVLRHLMPLSEDGRDLYDKVQDGVLLCKTVNLSCPDTIDERVINTKNLTVYTRHENLTLALNSSQAIGCNIINIDAHDLAKGKPHLVLGLLWQIIRIGLFNQITLEQCPGLALLLQPGEKLSDLMRLSPEAILLRWVNYQLQQAGVNRTVNNFTNDIKDSEVYTHLMRVIAPKDAGVNTEALMEMDHLRRAEVMLQQAEKLGCRSFVTSRDVVDGIYKLNLAFVANLFNNHPGLDKPSVEDIPELDNMQETREEKTYRNWMNSMGASPYVNWLYNDLADGLVIFQLYDIIKPGIVDWNRVHKKFSRLRAFLEKLENCNYAVELGRQLKFSLVGIAGQDLNDGNQTLTLALVWQLMRSYTLSILTQLANTGHPLVEAEIVDWVNKKLAKANKTSSIKSFQDSSIRDAVVVIDLIDAISPGTIDYSLVKGGKTEEECMANAKFAISNARKMGARIYALPEDIAEVKSKMVMTVFACLMARDYIPNFGSKSSPSEQSA